MAEDNPSSDDENQSSDDQQSDHAIEETNIDEDDDNTTFKDLVSHADLYACCGPLMVLSEKKQSSLSMIFRSLYVTINITP